MRHKFIADPQDPFGDGVDAAGDGINPTSFPTPASHDSGNPSVGAPALIVPPLTPTLPAEAVEAQAAQNGSGGTGSVVAETSSSGFTINLIFDAAAMASTTAAANFRAGIEQAASILSATITNKITVNINIDYSGTGGGAAAGPDNGQYESYSTVRADLISDAAPGDTTFNALPTGSTIQGQSQVAVWNAQLKLFGLLSPNSTTTDDGSATFATDIQSNLLVGVALHELTHALGRVPYGSQPDIFDFYRFTSPGAYLFSSNIPATAAYFSVDGGNTKLADFGLYSDPSDFLNAANGALPGPYSNLTPNDAFDELYGNNTTQGLSAIDKQMLDALGFNTIPYGIAVAATASEAVQGGARVTLLSGLPSINDPASTTLSSATIEIANGGGSEVAGDELFVNGVQSGSVGNGVTATWNASTGALTLSGNASLAVYDALLSEVSYQDTGTDTSSGSHPVRTVTWTVNDGTNTYATTSQIAVDRVPVATNAAATDAEGSTLTVTAATGVLSSNSDLDGDRLTVTGVSDVAHGAGSVGSSLAGVYGHLTLNADGSYTYAADNLSAINAVPAGSHAVDSFTYTESDGYGGTATATLSITVVRPPVVTTSNLTDLPNQTIAASSLFTVTDPNGYPITQYEFWDSTQDPNSGHFFVNGVEQAPGTIIDISASELAQTTFVTGSVSNAIQVRAFDGINWSASDAAPWAPFNVNISPAAPPVVTTSNLTDLPNQTIAASSLFTVTDPNGYPITQYEFWDSTHDPNSGHFFVNGVEQAPGTIIDISASELAQTTFVTGSVSNAIQVRAFDGINWSASDTAPWSPFNVNISLTASPVDALELTGADAGSVTFSSPTGMLILDHSSTFSGEIFNFTGDGSLAGSDQINLKDISFNSVHDSYANGVLTITDGTNTAELNFNGSYTLANFKFANDGSGGTIVYDPPAPPSNPPNVIVSNAGNAVLTGHGGGDNFVFNQHLGQTTITNFSPGADAIQFDHSVFPNAAAVLAHDDGSGNAVINDSTHDTIMGLDKSLPQQSVHIADLFTHNFIIH
jgi:serralysin